MGDSGCPPRGDIARLIESRLDPGYSEEIRKHFKSCYACESLYALGTVAIRGPGSNRQNPLEKRRPQQSLHTFNPQKAFPFIWQLARKFFPRRDHDGGRSRNVKEAA